MADFRPVHVTRPYLPPLEELAPYLEEIWNSRVLTNSGPLHERLEHALCDYLGVAHLSLVANGTLGLILSLRALGIRGEVITTPYSYVATSHALLWNDLVPVFVDIDPDTLTIDPHGIEAALTPHTGAILPVHGYGFPCDVAAIAAIAADRGIPVVYDAAHAFGVRAWGTSILAHGAASVVSFHATKVFNTFEGGAVVCRDAATKKAVDSLKNLGFTDGADGMAAGMNAKMSEFNAAVGLAQLPSMGAQIARRGAVDARYRRLLADCRGIRCLTPPGDTTPNHTYFPIMVGPDYPIRRDALLERLSVHGVNARPYFHPLISDHPLYRHLPSAAAAGLPVARRVAMSVICLPIHPDLDDATVDLIADLIVSA